MATAEQPTGKDRTRVLGLRLSVLGYFTLGLGAGLLLGLLISLLLGRLAPPPQAAHQAAAAPEPDRTPPGRAPDPGPGTAGASRPAAASSAAPGLRAASRHDADQLTDRGHDEPGDLPCTLAVSLASDASAPDHAASLPAGRPPAGLSVWLQPLAGEDELPLALDAAGPERWALELPPGDYQLMATAPAGLTLAQPLALRCAGHGEEVALELRLVVACQRVRGTVLDRDGLPLADAWVLAVPLQAGAGASERPGRVADDGGFELALPCGVWSLHGGAPGYTSAASGALVGPSPRVALVLEREARLRGRVLDAAGAGVAGALVALRSVDEEYSGATRQDGSFDLPVHPGSVLLSAWAPGRGWASLRLTLDSEGADQQDLELRLRPGVALLGQVRRPDQEPLPGRQVRWLVEALALGGAVTSGLDGGLVIPDLPPGTAVTLLPAGAASATRLDGGAWERTPLVLTLAP